MEFRKMITLYAKQKKRHRCIEQTFGLCGRRQGWMFQENSIETCILSRVKQVTRLDASQVTRLDASQVTMHPRLDA